MSTSNHSFCAIHFEGKKGEIKKFTETTLAKILSTREWLSLPSCYQSFTDVAKKSLEFIDGISDASSLENTCGYHLACYRTCTDISKLERAKITLANSGKKRVAEEESDVEGNIPSVIPAKVIRTTTHRSLANLTAQPSASSSRSSNLLPEICLICKQPGHIYITDRVVY
jgi:hypothetical protein